MRVVRVTYSKREDHLMMILPFGREEVTRTPDPHVPNVVRYQLRYFSDLLRKSSESLESSLF